MADVNLFSVVTVANAAKMNLIPQLQTQTVGLLGETERLPVPVPYQANAKVSVAQNSVPTGADNLPATNTQNQKNGPVAQPAPWISIKCGKVTPKSRSLGLMPHNAASLNLPGRNVRQAPSLISNPVDYTS